MRWFPIVGGTIQSLVLFHAPSAYCDTASVEIFAEPVPASQMPG
jgi:hypothetical protein